MSGVIPRGSPAPPELTSFPRQGSEDACLVGGDCRLNLLMKSFAGARCSAWHPRDATFLTLGPVSSRLSPLLTQPKAIDHVAWPPAHCPTSLCRSPTLVEPGHTWLPMSSARHPGTTIHTPPPTLIYLITGLTGTRGTSSGP